MSTSIEMHVDPASFRQLRSELYGFDRALLGKLNSRIKRAVEPVKAEAESNAAVLAGITDKRGKKSGIARAYENGKHGVKIKVGGRTTSAGMDAVVRLIQENKGAAIAEFAASGHTDAGKALVDRLSQLGSPGRFAWKAMDAHKTEIEAQIKDEVDKTVAEFNAKVAAGDYQGVLI